MCVNVALGVGVKVDVWVRVREAVGVAERVRVTVGVGELVAVEVGPLVGEWVGVGVGSAGSTSSAPCCTRAGISWTRESLSLTWERKRGVKPSWRPRNVIRMMTPLALIPGRPIRDAL